MVAAGALAGLLVGPLLFGGSNLTSTPSPTAVAVVPTASPTAVATASPTVATSASPTPLPTGPAPTASGPAVVFPTQTPAATPPAFPDADATTVATISHAAHELAAIGRYRFFVSVAGRAVDDLTRQTRLDYALEGSLVRDPVLAIDALFTSQLVEPGEVAAVTSTGRIVVIGNRSWSGRPGQALQESNLTLDQLERLTQLLPDALIERAIIPFAGAYAPLVEERRNGTTVMHYRATRSGIAVIRKFLALDGDCSADLWIALEVTGPGHLVAAETSCEARSTARSAPRGFFMKLDISDPDDPDITVVAP